jgi:hypothetical protein
VAVVRYVTRAASIAALLQAHIDSMAEELVFTSLKGHLLD